MDLASRQQAVQETFERIRRDTFDGDPICNEHLDVEVLEAETVGGIDTMAVITPWSIVGLCFPPEDLDLPDELMMGLRPRRLLPNELPRLGTYRSVALTSDCERLESMEAAREVVRRATAEFRQALARELDRTTVERPDRRTLLLGPGR
jgi:hypothetical protein